jgi:hypothetical protein
MKLQPFVQGAIARIIVGVANAPMMLPRLFVALVRKLRSSWRALVIPQGRKRGGPDDGSQGAGVTARLKPPPPVLSAAAAKALPEPGEYESA